MPTSTQVREALRQSLAQECLLDFVQQAWPVLEPNTPYVHGKHIEIICSRLEAVTRGEVPGIVFNIPPGMMKTLLVAVCWPAWEWIERPWLRYNVFSYAEKLSKDSSRFRRKLIGSDWYKALAPHVQIADDNNQVMEFASNHPPGAMIASSVGGVATGRGGERLIIDDSMNPRIAASELETESTQRWLRETLPSRIRNQEIGATVIIEQRLGLQDATSLALELGFEHVCLPMEYEIDHPHPCKFDWRTTPGELLCPARVDGPQLARIKKPMGVFAYATQYQQRPAARGGNIWRDALFKECRIEHGLVTAGPFRQRIDNMHRFNVADLAYSEKQTADYTVIGSFAGDMETGNLFLTNVFRARLDVLGAAEAGVHQHYLIQQREQANAAYTIIEKAGLALKVIELLQRKGEPVIGVDADREKVARAYSAVPLAESGCVWVPKQAEWWPTSLAELCAFPNGAHDDVPDVVAYGCLHWQAMLVQRLSPEEKQMMEAAYNRPSLY